MALRVIPLPAFSDNYIWVLHQSEENQVVVVDPGDAKPVLEYLGVHGYQLSAILITHHHADHQGGIPELLSHFPNVPVYGPVRENITGCTYPLSEGEQVEIPGLSVKARVLEIPGHTSGHIAYYIPPHHCFCGDTLFSAGCGRLFEGTPQQMLNSLQKLIQLGDDTLIYCAHEYTLKNLQFAQMVEPDNLESQKHYQAVTRLRQQNLPTLPSTIALEKKINPFLRCQEPTIVQAIQKHDSHCHTDLVSLFSTLRQWKNSV